MGYFVTRASPARGVAKIAGIGAVYRAKSEKAVCGVTGIKIASPSGRAGDARAGLRPLFLRFGSARLVNRPIALFSK